MNPTSNLQTFRRWLPIIVLALLLLVVCRTALAIYTRANTGLLKVVTTEPNAIVSISQKDKKAAFLGKGDVSARLKPGDYLVTATLAGDLATATVHITSGNTTTKRINPVHVTPPPSAAALTSFLNFDVLVNGGIEVNQVTKLKRSFLEFASNAKIISIDTATIRQLPHDPNDDFFQKQFDVRIDDVTYHALIHYVSFGDTILYLTNDSGQQVYNSEASSSGE